MVIKPLRKSVRRWSNALHRMWGIRANPKVVNRWDTFKYFSGGPWPVREAPEKGVKRSRKGGDIATFFLQGATNPNVRDKRKGQIIYVNQNPHLMEINGKIVSEDTREPTMHVVAAHELGHTIANSMIEGQSKFSDFLSDVSEWEYLKRHHPGRFNELSRPLAITIELPVEGLPYFMQKRRPTKRYLSKYAVHEKFSSVLRRLFRHFPRAKERNAIVRELIAMRPETSDEINRFLWKKIRAKNSR